MVATLASLRSSSSHGTSTSTRTTARYSPSGAATRIAWVLPCNSARSGSSARSYPARPKSPASSCVMWHRNWGSEIPSRSIVTRSAPRLNTIIPVRSSGGTDTDRQTTLRRPSASFGGSSLERLSVLFDLATARLVERKVLLPGVTVLERLVSSVRSRAAARLWHRLSALPSLEQSEALDALLAVPEGGRQSNLDRLRRSPAIVSAQALRQALERLEEVESLQVGNLDLSGIPQGRVDALARQANAARAQAIARMPGDRRIATLVSFASHLERTACDGVLNLADLELGKLLTDADREGKAKRKKTLKAFDQAAVLLRDAVLIVMDPAHQDLEQLREKIYARASHDELAEAAACVEEIARPHGTHHYEELLSRYRSVRKFLPKLLELPFEGLPAGQAVLEGLAAIRALEGRRRVGLDEIPKSLVTPAWEPAVFIEPGQVERRAFTCCVLEHLRSALRRRDVFVAKSTQWGDPRAQLIPTTAWNKARASTCRMLGLSSSPEPFLASIGQELDDAYRRTADRWPENEAVRIETSGKQDELVLTGLGGLDDPPSLEELREVTERMLPRRASARRSSRRLATSAWRRSCGRTTRRSPGVASVGSSKTTSAQRR